MSSRDLESILARESNRSATALSRAWSQVSPTEDFDRAWREYRPRALQQALGSQRLVSTAGALAVPAQLSEQGIYIPSAGVPNIGAFAGLNGDGRRFVDVLDGVPIRTRALMRGGASASVALDQARRYVTTLTMTMLADTARAVMQTQLAARTGMVYVRRVEGGACGRCLILAGKIYRWNQGFQRHPRCCCTHFLTRRGMAGGERTDPYEIFNSMSRADQDRALGPYAAEAVRDGADMYQVVNARRGMSVSGLTTSEGTSRWSAWRKSGAASETRLTPAGIYRRARTREEALRELERYGYILPTGQISGGSIRGRALGVGRHYGERKALELWDTAGIRDPRSIHTMTAAERRVADARWQLAEIRAGRNPFERSAVERRFPNARYIVGKTPGPPLSPRRAAAAEQSAQLWIAANGESVEYQRLSRLLKSLRIK